MSKPFFRRICVVIMKVAILHYSKYFNRDYKAPLQHKLAL